MEEGRNLVVEFGDRQMKKEKRGERLGRKRKRKRRESERENEEEEEKEERGGSDKDITPPEVYQPSPLATVHTTH